MSAADSDRRGDAQLVIALASGKTWSEAAGIAGVSEATVARRMREPEFRAELLEARARMVERSVGLLAAATADAATTLRRLLSNPQDSVALAAARCILEQTIRLTQHVVLEQRIGQLEEVARGVETGGQLRRVQ